MTRGWAETMANSSKSAKYDCIIIGGGHNGLIAAAYLAKRGKSVCVLERRPMLGGCSVTEELWPGYKVSTASYVVSLLLPEIISDLQLKQNGLTILPRVPSSFTPMRDGRHLMLGRTSNRITIRSPVSVRLMQNLSRIMRKCLRMSRCILSLC